MMVLRNIILVPYMWIRLCWHATHVDKYTLAEHFKILRYIVAHANKGGNVKIMNLMEKKIYQKKMGLCSFQIIRGCMMCWQL